MRLLQPMPADRRPTRLALLLTGLALYGVSTGLMLQAGLGVLPWGVLHQGLSRAVGLQVGTWTILVGIAVLLLWWPLRLRPGVGTVANALLIGVAINATLAIVPAADTLLVQAPLLSVGVLLNGVATGAYIGAGLGAGPRDGLSIALAARGHSLRLVRTSVEVVVLAVGWLLGGTVGVGTLLYALSIGPITHRTVPALRLGDRARPGPERAPLP